MKEQIAEEIIKKQVGIQPGASDQIPMDYGECKLCIIAALQDSGKALEEIKAFIRSEKKRLWIEYSGNTDPIVQGIIGVENMALGIILQKLEALAGINETKEK